MSQSLLAWICKILLLTGWRPSCQSLNAYGLLLERQGLLSMAAKSMDRCVNMAVGDENIDVYRANLARILWYVPSMSL